MSSIGIWDFQISIRNDIVYF